MDRAPQIVPKIPTPTYPTAEIIPFPKRRQTDGEVREHLRGIYLNSFCPFEERIEAVIMAVYFGEDVSKVMEERKRA
jgi:hypothetical protein